MDMQRKRGRRPGGVSYRKRGKKSYLVTLHYNGAREYLTVDSKETAEQLVREIHRRMLCGDDVIGAVRARRAETMAPTPAPATFPALRAALPTWIDAQALAGELRASTSGYYRRRCAAWVYPHPLADGRVLGDLPVNEVTREMLGAVIRRIREAGRSLAIVESVRSPLRGFFANLIESKALPGPNPAADLRFFIGKRADKRAKARQRTALVFFGQEEGPQLVGTVRAMFPRWAPFVMTGLLAGLRWGESAALERLDIDFKRGRIHVQRTVSDGSRIEPCKDGEDRWVKATPALLTALRAHLEAMDLDGQMERWTPEQRALVFPNKVGRIVHYPGFLTDVWRPLLLKAGLPYRKYHATRHSYATWMLEDGADVRFVQAQLGHASIEQTVSVYGHLVPERHEAAVAGLDRYLTV